MYKKALAGDITNFAREEPENPELILETDEESVEESAQMVINILDELGYTSRKREK